jgi:hypothetical protein
MTCSPSSSRAHAAVASSVRELAPTASRVRMCMLLWPRRRACCRGLADVCAHATAVGARASHRSRAQATSTHRRSLFPREEEGALGANNRTKHYFLRDKFHGIFLENRVSGIDG